MADQLAELLGVPRVKAENLLAMSNGDVQVAANLYFTAQASPPQNTGRTAASASAPVVEAPSLSSPPVPEDPPQSESSAPSSCDLAVLPGGKEIKIRVSSPAGNINLSVDNHTPLGLFKHDLHTKHAVPIPPELMKIMCGSVRPPKPLADTPEATLASLGVARGESLVISKSDDAGKVLQGRTNGKYIPPTDKNRSFTRREMPADNSCLFHACRYVLSNKERGDVTSLRKQIADIVQSDPGYFTTEFLGQPNAHYAQWIQHKDNWGGAIELSILSVLHEVEICALDVQTKRMYRYGEDKDYTCRAFVLYSGRHYDAMALAEYGGAPDANDQVLFGKSDTSVFKKAEQFIDSEHGKFLANPK